MDFKDKYAFTKDENIRFARSNFAELIHTDARFEGVNTTLPQTKTILAGMGVSGVSIDDINVIIDLKRGWNFITSSKDALTLEYEQKINQIVAARDSLDPGNFREGQGSVYLGQGESFTPPDVDIKQERDFLLSTLSAQISTTDKALTVLYHNMRNQIFWDGNKRTAMLTANKIMIDGGAGLINVPLSKWENWNELISAYYKSGDMTEIKLWTYQNGIKGLDARKNKQMH